MSLKVRSKEWFDWWSETYDRFLFRRLMWHWQDATISKIPSDSRRILDVACGTGVGVEKALKRFPNAEVCGIDLSSGMVAKAKERLGKRARIVRGDVENLPFADGYFDAVFCTEAFHHFPNPSRAVKDMARVTRTGGVVIITDINFPPLFVSNLLFRLEPGFVRMHSRKEMERLLNVAGLRMAKQERIGLFALLSKGRKA